jgi:hypothetical protein
MHIADLLGDLALRALRGDGAGEVFAALRDQGSARGQCLLQVLYLAQQRAWQTLEIALAGLAWWEQVRPRLQEPDEHAMAMQVAFFLNATPLPELAHKTYFRSQCLRELQQLRRQGMLAAAPDPRELEHRLVGWLRDPGHRTEEEVLEGLAREFERLGGGALAWLLRQRTGTLLALCIRFFFRRAAEEDPDLAGQLAFDDRAGPGMAAAAALAALRDALRTHGGRLQGLLDGESAGGSSAPLVQDAAAVHFQAYRAALAAGRYDEAVAELRETLAADGHRFAPFPPEDFQPQRILAADDFGVTFLCVSVSLGKVIIQALAPEGPGRRPIATTFREAITYKQTRHSVLLPLRRWGYVDEDQARPYLMYEYFDAPTLEQYVGQRGSLPFEDFREVARIMAEGLWAAHLRGVLHLALRPSCVLVRHAEDRWEVRLMDFGLAFDGTPGEAEGPAADLRGFGRTCCWALLGITDPHRGHWKETSPNLAELLTDCMADDPAQRPASFAVVLQRLARVQPPRKAPRLVVLRGLRPGAEYVLGEGASVIGRGGESPVDVDLDDQEPDGAVLSSRRHALLSWKDGRLSVTDLHSANGTFVNRVPLAAGREQPLESGDTLQIGSAQLRVQL